MPAPRILVLDDNPELLTLLSSAFEEAGYQVQTAARGRTAVELARKDRPDLAVIDVLLPDLMGFDVAEALKKLRIPFIFMSGVHKGGKASANALGKYGALAYFEKPFDRTALLEAVTKVVPLPRAEKSEQAWDVEAGPQVGTDFLVRSKQTQLGGVTVRRPSAAPGIDPQGQFAHNERADR